MEAVARGWQVPIGGELAEAEGVTRSFVNRLLRLTPGADIVEPILDGRQPKGLQLEELTQALPSAWEEQRATPPQAVAGDMGQEQGTQGSDVCRSCSPAGNITGSI